MTWNQLWKQTIFNRSARQQHHSYLRSTMTQLTAEVQGWRLLLVGDQTITQRRSVVEDGLVRRLTAGVPSNIVISAIRKMLNSHTAWSSDKQVDMVMGPCANSHTAWWSDKQVGMVTGLCASSHTAWWSDKQVGMVTGPCASSHVPASHGFILRLKLSTHLLSVSGLATSLSMMAALCHSVGFGQTTGCGTV